MRQRRGGDSLVSVLDAGGWRGSGLERVVVSGKGDVLRQAFCSVLDMV